MGHRNICCDGCQRQNFYGRRFKCLRCVNYDLCGDCYDIHMETQEHSIDHPMQLLVDNQLPDLLLGGEALDLMHLPNCYTCPHCLIYGHTAKQLIEHVVCCHRLSEDYVVCPLCAGLPGIELVAIRNLARHLLLNHIEHANLLDPDTPPLRRSLRSRRRRRQASSAFANNNTITVSSQSSHSSSIDSEAGIDVLFQISELRRSGVQEQRQTLDIPIEISEEDTHSRSGSISVAAESISNSSTRTVEELTSSLSISGTQTATARPDANKYLLLQWMQAEHDRLVHPEQATWQRVQHGIFAEHLLASMLCDEELRTADEPAQEEKPSQKCSLPETQIRPKLNQQKSEPTPKSPSDVMIIMSLPWAGAWQALSKNRSRTLDLVDATLDESELNGDCTDDENID